MIAIVKVHIPEGFEAVEDGSYRAEYDITPGKSDFSLAVGMALMSVEAEEKIRNDIVEIEWKGGEW